MNESCDIHAGRFVKEAEVFSMRTVNLKPAKHTTYVLCTFVFISTELVDVL